jgi:hypothetical protein
MLDFVLGAQDKNNEYPKDFLMGYDKPEDINFEYTVENGIVYVSFDRHMMKSVYGSGSVSGSMTGRISSRNVVGGSSSSSRSSASGSISSSIVGRISNIIGGSNSSVVVVVVAAAAVVVAIALARSTKCLKGNVY